MSLSFANLAGFWALLGIPAILLIHFLQRQSQVLTISTLFLLDQMRRESVSGRRFEKIRTSIPLWLQLLMVLLLTWLLVQPRWVRPDSVQRIAVVLDSSASMSAFKDNLVEQLSRELTKAGQSAFRTEFVVIDSQVTGEPIYNGTELNALMETVIDWDPAGPDHDFGSALRIGRSLVGGEGLVVLATDHLREELPYNARLLAVGEKKDNVGFAGLNVVTNDDGELLWQAIVRNYSDEAQTRSWVLQAGQQRTAERAITLEPGEVRSLQGQFPEGSDQIVLRMKPDDFPFDDSLPAVRPRPKPFAIVKISSPDLDQDLDEILSSFENLTAPSEENPPDLALVSYEPLDPRPVPDVAIALLHESSVAKAFIKGRIAAENHPLVAGLNWQGLIARDSPNIPRADTDTVLVWQGKKPLIFFRTAEGRRQLFVNFDFPTSNANRLPAFIVMLHRFVEDLRARKIAGESANFEIAQEIPLAISNSEGASDLELTETAVKMAEMSTHTETIPLARASLLRAPGRPGFFEIRQGEGDDQPGVLLRAATHFADTREADLRMAATRSDLSGVEATLIEQHTERDSRWQIWLLLALSALLASWYFVNRPSVSAKATTLNRTTN